MVAAAIGVCGCGGPEGAGTVNMAAFKEAGGRKGIPDAKNTSAPKAKIDQAGQRGRARPPGPLPKGGR